MSDIPEWALKRACHLTAVNLEPAEMAFARYIAAHEEAPVDPLLVALKEAVAEVLSGFEGDKHAELYARRITALLTKRGIELASKP